MKVFLSYAQADKPWAGELAALLEQAGLDIMEGIGHVGIAGNWEVALRQVLESADLVVFLLTRHSLHNPWVLFEFGAASSARKTLLPLLLENEGERLNLPNWIAGRNVLRVESPQAAAAQVKQYVSEQMAGV